MLTFSAQTGSPASTSLKRTIEHNGVIFTDSGTIFYPENFKSAEFNLLIQKIGYVYPPFSKVEHIKHAKDQLMFKALYRLGNYGLRSDSPTIRAPFHLIIAGDSNVFGEGCNENETVTARLSGLIKDHHVYNFGHRGGGPHNTLSLWEHFPVQNLITEKKGLFIYDLFSSHMLERVIGGKNYVAWDNGISPWYELNDKDEPVFKGQFKDKKITALYSFLSSSTLMNWLFPVLPRINSDHLHLVSKIFVKMKALYLASFPEGKFIVLLNNSTMKDEHVDELRAELEKYKIETINLPFQERKVEPLTFKDMHFNPEGQKWQAELISAALKNLSSSSSDQQQK